MQLPRRVLAVLVVAFLLISAFALKDRSYLELWQLIGQDSGTVQLFADLTVAMVLVTTWMARDGQRTGVPAWPWIGVTVLGGSVGPLGYLVYREIAGKAQPRGPSLSHLTLPVSDPDRSAAFYDAVLGTIGAARSDSPLTFRAVPSVGPGVQLTFTARDHAAVESFHAAALANGGTSEGEPARVKDPDGHLIEIRVA